MRATSNLHPWATGRLRLLLRAFLFALPLIPAYLIGSTIRQSWPSAATLLILIPVAFSYFAALFFCFIGIRLLLRALRTVIERLPGRMAVIGLLALINWLLPGSVFLTLVLAGILKAGSDESTAPRTAEPPPPTLPCRPHRRTAELILGQTVCGAYIGLAWHYVGPMHLSALIGRYAMGALSEGIGTPEWLYGWLIAALLSFWALLFSAIAAITLSGARRSEPAA